MDWNRWKDIYRNMSPEMKEQATSMAKAQIKEKLARWFSQPVLVAVALVLGAIVGTLTAFFGQVLDRVGAIRDANPLYWIPALALGVVIMVAGYTFGRAFIYGTPAAAVTKLPYQILQAVVGAAGAWLLVWKAGLKKLYHRFTR